MQGCRTRMSAPYAWERSWTRWWGWARPPGQPCLYGCFGFRPNSPPYTMICRWAWIRSSAAGSWWHNFTPNAQRETTGSISPPQAEQTSQVTGFPIFISHVSQGPGCQRKKKFVSFLPIKSLTRIEALDLFHYSILRSEVPELVFVLSPTRPWLHWVR